MRYVANYKFIALTALLIVFIPLSLSAQNQDSVQIARPNLYLDCFRCPEQYLKEHIDIVNFVRSPSVAQIQLVLTRARTGAGSEITMRFVGLAQFEGMENTIIYFSSSTDTEQEEREDFLQHVRLGLLPFIAQSDLREYVEVTYANIGIDGQNNRLEDPWNHWIFDISANASFEGRETRRSYEVGGRLSAERVTKELKVDIDFFGDYERTFVDLEVQGNDNDSTTTFVKTFSFLESSKRFNALAVKSLSQHWSIGSSAFAYTSTFNNIDLKFGVGPALEYNIFPYREYNRHQFSFLYEITPAYVQYNDTTIYNKIDQFLVEQSISAIYELTETWGEIFLFAQASAYLHNFSRNRINLRGRANFRIYRGLSVFIGGGYSLINDQLALPKGDITNRQALLRLRDRATGFSYDVRFGLSFTFGSIYNNIVNPRFGR